MNAKTRLDPELDLAMRLHQGGQFKEAERRYRELLSQPAQERNSDLLHFMGLLCAQTNRLPQAKQWMESALAIEPAPHILGNYGLLLGQMGEHAQALEIYEKIIKKHPKDAHAYYNHSMTLMELKQHEQALKSIDEALRLMPGQWEWYRARGTILHQMECYEDALKNYEQGLLIKPKDASLLHQQGLALKAMKRYQEALTRYNLAIENDPQQARFYVSRGIVLRHLEQYTAGLESLNQAIAINPKESGAYFEKGRTLLELKSPELALKSFQTTIALNPKQTETWQAMAIAYQDLRQFALALAAAEESLRIAPKDPEAHNNRANALHGLGRFDEAINAFQEAIRLKPALIAAYNNQGLSYQYMGDFESACQSYQKAISILPNSSGSHWGLGLCYLLQGDFLRGWEGYEWRWRMDNLPLRLLNESNLSMPRWQGQTLQGKKILLYAEQGLGDTIQFSRYANVLSQQGAERVYLLVQTELKDILGSLEGVYEMIDPNTELLPACDYHCPLLSLPRILGTTIDTIPTANGVPPVYLQVSPEQIDRWAIRLKTKTQQRGGHIGIVVSGNSNHYNDHHRSIPLEQILKHLIPVLTEVSPSTRLVFLQDQIRESDQEIIDKNPKVCHFISDIRNFTDTAAIIMNLRLVISVDTAVAHLAAALRCTTWVLLPHTPDWRWMLHRLDSPWYPTMRLFRQTKYNDWVSALEDLSTAVTELLRLSAPPQPLTAPVEQGTQVVIHHPQLLPLAIQHHREGRYQEAEHHYQQILNQNKDNFDALHMLGVVHLQTGRIETAQKYLYQALKLSPDNPSVYHHLAVLLLEKKDYSEALDYVRYAIQLEASSPEFYATLASILQEQKQLPEGLEAAQQALALSTSNTQQAQYHNQIGIILKEMEQWEKAEQAYRVALNNDPQYLPSYNNYSLLLQRINRHREAQELLKRGLAIKSDYPSFWLNLGANQEEMLLFPEALISYDRAIALEPQNPNTRLNRSMCLLRMGDFIRGWKEYEIRWQTGEFKIPELHCPRWEGQDLKGKKILCYSEQGLGDTIQFCRYIPLIKAQGAIVALVVQAPLKPLLASLQGVDLLLAHGEGKLPVTDYHCPLMSLPFLFQTTINTVPWKGAYLTADKGLALQWQKRLADCPRPWIGIAWSGSKTYRNNHNRSMPLANWIDGFPHLIISLHHQLTQEEENFIASHPQIRHYGSEMDFMNTAALISVLDQVISTDTSLVHLAGALDRPVICLLSMICDWRWMHQRTDTPWYPRMQLLRQTHPGDWQGLLKQAYSRLNSLSLPTQHFSLDIEDEFRKGFEQHREGLLDNAWQTYQRVLQKDPQNFNALHLSGVILFQKNNFQEALRWIEKARGIQPEDPEAAKNHISALLATLQYTEALEVSRTFLSNAVSSDERSQWLYQQGFIKQHIKDYPGALVCYDHSIEENPHFAQAWGQKAIVLKAMEFPEQALQSCDKALSLQPEAPETWNNRGLILQILGRDAEALASYVRAIQQRPEYPIALNNQGVILEQLGRFEEAIQSYRTALAIDPDYVDVHNNQANSFQYLHNFKEALACYDRTLARRPDYAKTQFNQAICRMLTGDWQGGWQQYEWRWKIPSFPDGLGDRLLPVPEWRGQEPLQNKRILLYAEQGLGDTLQFCRYASLIKERGGHVILEVPEPLVELLKSLQGVDYVLSRGDPMPDIDYQCPLMSLPWVLDKNGQNIPGQDAYLFVPDTRIQWWKKHIQQLSPSTPGLKRIGLAWKGSSANKNNLLRSIALSLFLKILISNNFPQYHFFVLHHEIDDEEKKQLKEYPQVFCLAGNFTETAALISQLDLVISVDTSLAHLSAAMGKLTWILLPWVPDFRWLLERENTPWYHSVRLFRQPQYKNWEAVLLRVREMLQQGNTQKHL